MSQTFTLEAQKRDVLGRKVKQLRKTGNNPAVLYGLKQDPISLTINSFDFVRLYEKAGSSTLIDVVIDGAPAEKALIGEIRIHPVTNRLRHVDLKRVDMTSTIQASIKLEFVGESLAVKGLNGSLMTQLDGVDVECLPTDLVSEIEVDLAALETFEDSIYVRDLKVSDKLTILTDADQLVATVTPPRSEEEMAALDEEVVEDVTGVDVEEKGKTEEEGEGDGDGGEAKAEEPKAEEEKSE